MVASIATIAMEAMIATMTQGRFVVLGLEVKVGAFRDGNKRWMLQRSAFPRVTLGLSPSAAPVPASVYGLRLVLTVNAHVLGAQ
jgi:hypothetical protein